MFDRLPHSLLHALSAGLLALMLAACGGGDDPGGTDAAAAAAAAASAAPAGKQVQAGPSVNQFKANGWFWNPQEGGTGFMFEAQGNRGFVAFFMYEDLTAKPIWYAADGAFVANADGSFGFSGDLRVYRGGQAVSSATYRAPTSVSLGPVAISFSGNAATAQLPGGRQILATRYDYAGLGSAQKLNQPETGWYFNPEQGGRGYAIEVQNNELFMAMFHYNEDGSPTWNVVDGNIASGELSSQFQRFTGGQSLTSSYRSPGGASFLGDFTLSFRHACAGQVQFGGVAPVTLQRFVIGGGALPYGGECRYPSPNWYSSATYQRLEPGDVVYGHTGNPQPGYDVYAIRLVAGVNYTMDLLGEASGAGTLADPFLTLEYAGRQVAGNDNRDASTTDARLSYTPSVTSSAYYLRARSQNAGSGSFQLKVSGVAAGLSAQPVPPVAAYQGSYRGTVNGSETGGLQFTVSSAGEITGSLSLNQRAGPALALQGRVAYGGVLQQQERGGSHDRRPQCTQQQAARTDRLVGKTALEQRHAGRVGRIGDHGQPATGHGAGHQHVLRFVGDAGDQRAQVGQRRVVGDGRQRRWRRRTAPAAPGWRRWAAATSPAARPAPPGRPGRRPPAAPP